MSAETFLNGRVRLHAGDSRDVLKTIPDCSIDSIVTDPPYALVSIVKRFGGANAAPAKGNEAFMRASKGFMGKQWDTGETAFAADFWAECLRVLKPGGHVVAFSGTRTVHRMVCAIEDAGFEIRDSLQYLYGSGFPKSHDVSKGIDKAAGAEREVVGRKKNNKGDSGTQTYSALGAFEQTAYSEITAPATAPAVEWQGWGTALKPAVEPICLARKPLSEKTVAQNVLAHGTGAINIDGCRINPGESIPGGGNGKANHGGQFAGEYRGGRPIVEPHSLGRWPANVIHDGSDEVVGAFPDTESAGHIPRSGGTKAIWSSGRAIESDVGSNNAFADSGSAARFFYTSKADADDRLGSKHPTVKPVDLMQWLCRLVTPPGGTVLDPFAGTGTTGEAAFREGFRAVLIEREEEYQADIRRRMGLVMAGPDERARESIKAKMKDKPEDHGPLFMGAAE